MIMDELTGRIAIFTGASRRIGAAAAGERARTMPFDWYAKIAPSLSNRLLAAGSNRTYRRQPFGPWSVLFQLSGNSQQRALLSDARRHLHADGDTGLGPMQGQ